MTASYSDAPRCGEIKLSKSSFRDLIPHQPALLASQVESNITTKEENGIDLNMIMNFIKLESSQADRVIYHRYFLIGEDLASKIHPQETSFIRSKHDCPYSPLPHLSIRLPLFLIIKGGGAFPYLHRLESKLWLQKSNGRPEQLALMQFDLEAGEIYHDELLLGVANTTLMLQ